MSELSLSVVLIFLMKKETKEQTACSSLDFFMQSTLFQVLGAVMQNPVQITALPCFSLLMSLIGHHA